MILRINSICDLLGDGGMLFMILLQYSRFTKILWQGPGEVGWYSRGEGETLRQRNACYSVLVLGMSARSFYSRLCESMQENEIPVEV